MQSLKDKFDELRQRLGQGRHLDSIGIEPIFYLVFPVAEILEAKRQTKAWIAKLANDGWSVVSLSMAEALGVVLGGDKFRKNWLLGEQAILQQAEQANLPVDFREINKTLSKALCDNSRLSPKLVEQIESKLHGAESQSKGLLLITDLEALHPYLRINTIEAKLQGHLHCPMVVLYPGQREGKTSLRFLEFYPADPNYRSEHIG
jgi:bacteriophage exclusion system BrxB-like protein